MATRNQPPHLPQRARTRAGTRPAVQVSVRMYNVGFGDCFLVTITGADGNRRILFDSTLAI